MSKIKLFKNLTKQEIKIMIHNFIFVIIGTIVLAFGTEIFLAQSKLVTGGMSGIAITVDALLPFEESYFELIVSIQTWVFFFLGLIFLGKDFALKTLISSIVYPIALFVFSYFIKPDFLNGIFIIGIKEEISDPGVKVALEVVYESISAVFGGVFVGAGCALTFMGGGSTGGTDIIALIICKYFKKIKSSLMIFIGDALVVVSALFVLQDFILSLLGITSAFICAIVIDRIFIGHQQAFIAQIVSNKYDEINNMIINELERTTTMVDCTGGYSKESKKMLIVSFNMSEYSKMLDRINQIDHYAFVSISRAHAINGEGWTFNELNNKNKE